MPLADEETYELVCALRAQFPHVKILIITGQEDEEAIMRYVEAGIIGYLLQKEPVEEQMRKLRAASQDEALVSSGMAARLISHVSELEAQKGSGEEPESQDLGQLTNREEEVLGLVAQGLTNREIAQALFIAEGTVKSHIHRILGKLDAINRHEAAAAFLWARAQERAPVSGRTGASDGRWMVESG
jgi:DNA-binding NarL/FixJ family response regulator